ncbi:MAG: sulfite exporter TauE/SafE family protein [bacterium]
MDEQIIIYLIIGFVAQMIDGTLGMAYGVSSNSFLLSAGLPPAAASATVHFAELFTTGASAFFHRKFGNIDFALFKRLVIPGIAGGAVGAYILTELPGDKIKPFIAGYLLIMGVVILFKAFKTIKEQKVEKQIAPLGLIGGFFDAIGGGGWGPIVTSTLVAKGNNPRMTVGSVNCAEFFVTVAQSAVFIFTIGISHRNAVLGLIAGGVIAAPIAALVCKKIPAKKLMILVGILIISLSLRTIVNSF